MKQTPQFEVHVPEAPSGFPDDWIRAMNAPASEVPELTAAQKEFAKRFGLPEEDHARGELFRRYSQQRQRERGLLLGESIADILRELGDGYQLEALFRQEQRERWVAQIAAPGGPRNIAIPFEVTEDVIDSAIVQSLRELRRILLENLDRAELIRNAN